MWGRCSEVTCGSLNVVLKVRRTPCELVSQMCPADSDYSAFAKASRIPTLRTNASLSRSTDHELGFVTSFNRCFSFDIANLSRLIRLQVCGLQCGLVS